MINKKENNSELPHIPGKIQQGSRHRSKSLILATGGVLIVVGGGEKVCHISRRRWWRKPVKWV